MEAKYTAALGRIIQDAAPGNEKAADFATSPKTMMQMSLFTSAGFDSYVGDGPPVFLQRAVGFVLVPMARLTGFKSFYPEYDINSKHKI